MGRVSWSLGDVGFVGALLSVLVFQSLRHDPFESEKLGLLLVCSALMLAELLPHARTVLHRWRANPVILAVAALALVTLVSSGVALSPQRALVGSGFRSYGWIVIACETILVLYGAACGARLRTLVVPLLALTAIPLCLFALYQTFGSSPPIRPGGTTGNPNYLAAWLGLCLTWVLPSAFAPIKTHSQAGRWLLVGLWTALVLVTMNVTGSRAAFIALMLAGGAGVMLWGTLRRNLVPLAGLAVLTLMLAALLAIMQSGSSSQQGLARLLEPVDDFRQAAWTDSAALVQTMAVPLIDESGQPDPRAGLRPLLGYGLDNLDTLRVRTVELRKVTAASLILDRMHSLLYDSLFTTGALGLIALALVFESIWFSLLTSMHVLTSRRDVLACVGLQTFACVLIGLIGQAIGWTVGVSLVLSLLGLVVGLLLWLTLTTWRSRSAPPLAISPWLIGLWCASLYYFVCQLFGFQQIVSSILFAALIGFCASDQTEDEKPPQIDTLSLVLAIVTVFSSSLLRALDLKILLAMIGVLIGGWLAAMWLARIAVSWQKGVLYGGGLALLMLFAYKTRESLSLAMNQTLLAAPASSLTDLMLPTSGHGLLTLVCYAYAGLVLWKAGQPREISANRRRWALTIACLLGACTVFIASSTGQILWNTAALLDDVSGAQYAAEISYQGAEQLLPWTLELRIEHLRFLRTSAGASLGVDAAPLEQGLRTLDPFFNNQVTE